MVSRFTMRDTASSYLQAGSDSGEVHLLPIEEARKKKQKSVEEKREVSRAIYQHIASCFAVRMTTEQGE